MNPSIAVTHARLGYLPDPLLQVGLIGADATIMVARPLRPKHIASPSDADLPGAPNVVDELPPPFRPQSFRKTASCSIALSSDRSANKRFSLAFSSSSCRRRRISDGINPAYFLRQA